VQAALNQQVEAVGLNVLLQAGKSFSPDDCAHTEKNGAMVKAIC
jgi:hypothetical protein